MTTRSYSELTKITSFEDRFNYLKLGGVIGSRTFGGNRYLNQKLYSSYEWRRFRDEIILRDHGCDLGVPGYELSSRIYIHHINPLTEDDLKHSSEFIFDPDNVVVTSFATHEAIHYGNKNLLIPATVISRKPNDTCPWKGDACRV